MDGTHAVAAPNSTHIAFKKGQSLLRAHANSRRQRQLATLPPSVANSTSFIAWSQDSNLLLVVHTSGLLVLDGNARGERVRLQCGTGSLGHISSANFIGNDHLLVVWEFGSAKLFHMNSGRSRDLADIKTTCGGRTWQTRPGSATPSLFALLARTASGDQLCLHFSSLAHTLPPIKLPTLDAQSIGWSPDGRWLALLDVPTASPNLFIYTPDGHLFRSYPSAKESEPGLGIKNISWSPDGQLLALAKYDGKVELLNTRTFAALAVVEHSTTINQQTVPAADRALIWLEHVSASGERSYSAQAQPVNPPLSKTRADCEPKDLGVAEFVFSCDGRFLATRDCRMLNTIWIWNISILAAHTVITQHANVRSLQWHPTRPSTLLIDCAEGFAHIFDASSPDPPSILPTNMRPKASLSWMFTPADSKSVILNVEKSRFGYIFPEGQDEAEQEEEEEEYTPHGTSTMQAGGPFEEGASEDSLFEVLSGRKPLPPKTDPSYTEMVDLEMDVEDGMEMGALEDTFREKKKMMKKTAVRGQHVDVDPFDDSEIF